MFQPMLPFSFTVGGKIGDISQERHCIYDRKSVVSRQRSESCSDLSEPLNGRSEICSRPSIRDVTREK